MRPWQLSEDEDDYTEGWDEHARRDAERVQKEAQQAEAAGGAGPPEDVVGPPPNDEVLPMGVPPRGLQYLVFPRTRRPGAPCLEELDSLTRRPGTSRRGSEEEEEESSEGGLSTSRRSNRALRRTLNRNKENRKAPPPPPRPCLRALLPAEVAMARRPDPFVRRSPSWRRCCTRKGSSWGPQTTRCGGASVMRTSRRCGRRTRTSASATARCGGRSARCSESERPLRAPSPPPRPQMSGGAAGASRLHRVS